MFSRRRGKPQRYRRPAEEHARPASVSPLRIRQRRALVTESRIRPKVCTIWSGSARSNVADRERVRPALSIVVRSRVGEIEVVMSARAGVLAVELFECEEAVDAESADHESFFVAGDERLCPVNDSAVSDFDFDFFRVGQD